MAKQSPGKDLLENAYKLNSPDDNIAYYNKLAPSYDTDFAQELGYALPQAIADSYRALHTNDDAPIIDVGCGTGLLADALNETGLVMDGLDISAAMLKIAQSKLYYRKLHEVDLTKPVDSGIKNYGAILSCGTFTHGHLGPDALQRLFAMAKTGALFVLSINKEHYTHLGFESQIQTLLKAGRIKTLNLQELDIYSKAGHEHSDDRAFIVSFRYT